MVSTAESVVRLRLDPPPTFVQRFPSDLPFRWCLGTLFETAQERPREELLSSVMRRVRPLTLRLDRKNIYRRRSCLDSSPYRPKRSERIVQDLASKSKHFQRKADAATFSLDRRFMRREQLLLWCASALRSLASSLRPHYSVLPQSRLSQTSALNRAISSSCELLASRELEGHLAYYPGRLAVVVQCKNKE
jgi:hypothetical protein